MDDRVAVDILETSHDALLELLLWCHANVTQDRAGKLGEEALDEVELGTMPGCEGELETANRAGGEPAFGFLRYVRGMIVENQLDGGAGRIGGIKKLEEFNKLSAAVTVSDQGMNLAGEQIDPGQQAKRAVPLVLMITREGRVNAGFGRQIGRGRCDGLDSGFLVIRDDGYRLMRVPAFGGLLQNLASR